MKVANKVQLITYADSMGGGLRTLNRVLDSHFKGAFAGIHILPPFPSSGDRGFAPIDYHRIDPDFGSWEDVTLLSQKYHITLDVMVNHISRCSAIFKDFMRAGEQSAYAGYFLTPKKIWGTDSPPAEDLEKIVLRRQRPWSDYETENGDRVRVWTTFGAADPSEQIDLDVNNDGVRQYFVDLFRFFAQKNVAMLRLDAVGYVIKKPGTSCFFVEPEIYDFLEWIHGAAHGCGVELLSEVHAESPIQNRLAGKGYWIYDFLLPYTVLHTMIYRNHALFYATMKDRPQNQITMLDCHDGVPVHPDMDGWLRADEAWHVVETCQKRGARFTRLHSAEQKDAAYPDVHQICGTYYSLLGEDDDSYIAARAIQFFVPGVPQIYYVGLLAGQNDEQRWQREKDDRELNRHNYTRDEIEAACRRPVVKRLLRLIHLRNTHPAFAGHFQLLPAAQNQIEMQWSNGEAECKVSIDLTAMRTEITAGGPDDSFVV